MFGAQTCFVRKYPNDASERNFVPFSLAFFSHLNLGGFSNRKPNVQFHTVLLTFDVVRIVASCLSVSTRANTLVL